MIMEVKMRRVFFLFGILIVITAFSFSQSLTITSPSGAVSWEVGSSHLIQWTYGGVGNIMIQLYQSGSPVGTIYNGANSGNFSWTIDKYLNGNPIATGNYKLRVRSKNNSSIYAEIDLTITGGGSPGGSNVSITNPSGAVSWELNTTHMIQWTYGGSGDIMIQLYQSGSPAGTIYNGANSGSFSWTINHYLNSNPIATGSYKLRVRSKLDSSKYAEVDLTITGSSSITITTPYSGQTWYRGNTHTITWTKTGTMVSNVKIGLYNESGTSKVFDIVNNTDNDGSYDWKIPLSINTGKYRVKIITIDNLVCGVSDKFTLKSRLIWGPIIKKSIKVESPKSGERYQTNRIVSIRWKSTLLKARTRVKILLLNQSRGKSVVVISASTSNDGEMQWKIPLSVPTGDYKVRISTLTGNVYGDSGVFKITHKLYPIISFLPDLTVSAYVSPLVLMKSPERKDWLKGDIYISVRNIGKATAPKDVGVRLLIYYYDKNKKQWISNESQEYKIPFSIKAGKMTVKIIKDVGFMYNAALKVFIMVDHGSRVHESREDNNTFTKILNTD